MKEQLPVGLFGPDWFEVEPDELVDIGNAGKETIKYIRSDLLQKQIEEAVKKEQNRIVQLLIDEAKLYELSPRAQDIRFKTFQTIRNGEEA